MKKKIMLWFPAGGGLLLLALGVLMTFSPNIVARTLPLIIGIVLLFVGVMGIFYFALMRHRLEEPGIKLVQSLFNIITGIVFIAKQDLSVAFLTILFGVYVMVSAAINLSDSLQDKHRGRQLLGDILSAIFGFIMGFLLLFAPLSTGSLWVRFFGVYLIVTALNGLRMVHKLKKRREGPEDGSPDTEKDSPEEEQ